MKNPSIPEPKAIRPTAFSHWRPQPVKKRRSPRKAGTLLLGVVVVPLLINANAPAQIAIDRVHGYPLQGYATYTAGGAGHTGQAGDSAMDLTSSGGSSLFVTDPGFLASLNAATAGNTLSVSLWMQLNEIANVSAFWFYAASQDRAFQAHTPWSDDTVYFDTDGCCGSDTRISQPIAKFPGYSGTDAWWNSWHHFVFLKNGSDKQVWIDGALFLEGTGTAPLPSDIYWVDVGSDIREGGGSLHGKIDDFAVFGSALSSNDVHQIFTGTPPIEVTGANLIAFWDFNAPKTIFVPLQAGPGATQVSPDLAAYYVIANGGTAVQLNTIKLSVNGADVTGAATIVPAANPPLVEGSTGGATIYYTAPTPYLPNSVQNVTLFYSDNGTPATVFSNTWTVAIEPYNGYLTDVKNGYFGFLEGTAYFTPDGGGHTGKPGDRAIDLESVAGGGDVHVGAGHFLNQGATNNTLSFSLWMKLHAVAAGGAVFARSPSSGGGERGFAALPWNDGNLYFDTAGCCDMMAQRIVGDISGFTNSFWTNWHHYVFLDNATDKQIWIDGVQLIDGSSTTPLPLDFRDLFFGFDSADGVYQQAVIDDVAVFATPLSAANIGQLATNNASPTTLPGELLLAYWDFNTLNSGSPILGASSVPVPDSTNNLPDVDANIVILNRSTLVQTNSIRLALNGLGVTGSSTITSNAVGATISFTSPTLLAPLSSNTITISFADNASPPNNITNTWSFLVQGYDKSSRDVLHGYVGLFQGDSSFTPDEGGHTGAHGDRAFDLGTGGAGGATVLDSPFLAAVNAAAGRDTLSVSFWEKLYVIADSSVLWFNSPSVGRAFQAHAPWSDDTIYFDTGNGGPNRLSATRALPGWTNITFWTTWHNLVLLKNGAHKEVWIDGQMLTSGDTAAPMVTDIAELFMGSAPGGGSPHGQIDDFAVFGEALTSSQIASLASGTPPTALNDPKLLAFWNFEDVGPAFIAASPLPAPNAGGVSVSGPLSHVIAVLVDGSTVVQTNTIALKFNGSDVTASSAITSPQPTATRVEFAPPMLPALSSNVVTLTFSDNGSPAHLVSNTWSYVTETYTGMTKDVLHSYPGFLQPAAGFTTNGGGHTGNPGDYAIDLTTNGGAVHIDDASFLNPAGAANTMSFSFWMKRYDIANGSSFWVNSLSSPNAGLASQAYVPYSDDTVYWDTSGCCDTTRQRISAAISGFGGFTDDSFWTNHWHHFMFVYKAGDKQIWIDGIPFTEGTSSDPLPSNFADMFLGSDGQGGNTHALMDDFAAFASAVDPTNITALASGTLPTALKNETLLAYWPFDDASSTTRPVISIGFTGGQLKINFTGTLQSSATVNGTYQDVPGAPGSPYAVNTALGPRVFYRARQ